MPRGRGVSTSVVNLKDSMWRDFRLEVSRLVCSRSFECVVGDV